MKAPLPQAPEPAEAAAGVPQHAGVGPLTGQRREDAPLAALHIEHLKGFERSLTLAAACTGEVKP